MRRSAPPSCQRCEKKLFALPSASRPMRPASPCSPPKTSPDDRLATAAHYFVQIADKDAIFFEYTPRETSAAVSKLFEGFSGYVQADAKSVYDILFREPDEEPPDGEVDVRHEVACWSHGRRGFWEATVAKSAVAREGLARIGRIFELEALWTHHTAEERKRLRVQRAFGHFLAPILVERIVENDEALRLGGELRNVSVLFADLSGFTALSGRVPPDHLVEITNRYLSLVVRAVEATGGYVDKFIGDAVMALWGAPTTDPDHALHAVESAMIAVERVEALHAEDASRGTVGFTVKVGVNSGAAVVYWRRSS